ncbi:hypothetical protein C8R45DRAFT_933161 [Mycena sanguinolenta]|nr:hypothetical protein C8R45DRAFT_933161 [Mycena sanguinolenta]
MSSMRGVEAWLRALATYIPQTQVKEYQLGQKQQIFWPAYGGDIGCDIVKHSKKIAREKGYMEQAYPCEMLAIWAKKVIFPARLWRAMGHPTKTGGTLPAMAIELVG